jgi:hypothetical protein
MDLLLRRSERASSVLGKPIYILEVRAGLSQQEMDWVQKYKFGPSILYARNARPNVDTATVSGIGLMLLHHALNMTVSVNDLVHGKRLECKDIVEMLAAEEQIKEAARMFATVLKAAAGFGGEEVIPI